MSDKQNKVSEGHVRLESLPLEVQRLAEAMQSIDPKWSVEAWLIEQANMSMDLVKLMLLVSDLLLSNASTVWK